MSTQLELAKERLFGDNGMKARNIKFFPGTEEATAEQIAEEMNRAISQIETGNAEEKR